MSDLDWALATQTDVAGARHLAHPARTRDATIWWRPSFVTILHWSRGIIDKSLPGNYCLIFVVAFISTVSGCT